MKNFRTLLGMGFALAACLASAQSWSTAYEDGLKMLREHRWSEARQDFLQAAAIRPEDASSPTILPGPIGARPTWRDGSPYSPNFLAAYSALKSVDSLSASQAQKSLLLTIADELQVLIDKGQVSSPTLGYLSQVYTRLGTPEKAHALILRAAKREWRIDAEAIDAQELALAIGAAEPPHTIPGAPTPMAPRPPENHPAGPRPFPPSQAVSDDPRAVSVPKPQPAPAPQASLAPKAAPPSRTPEIPKPASEPKPRPAPLNLATQTGQVKSEATPNSRDIDAIKPLSSDQSPVAAPLQSDPMKPGLSPVPILRPEPAHVAAVPQTPREAVNPISLPPRPIARPNPSPAKAPVTIVPPAPKAGPVIPTPIQAPPKTQPAPPPTHPRPVEPKPATPTIQTAPTQVIEPRLPVVAPATATAPILARPNVEPAIKSALETKGKFALVIGNGESAMPGEKLSFAPEDAQRIRDALIADAGYPAGNVELLVNAPSARMLSAARSLSARTAQGSTLFLYFSGVGINVEGKDFLAGVDTTSTEGLVAKSELFRLFTSKGVKVFAFFESNRTMTDGRFFGLDIPSAGSIAQCQATLPGDFVSSYKHEGKEVGVYTQAFVAVLQERKSDQIPIGEFGWQLFYKVREGDSDGTISRQSPALPILSNMAAEDTF